jgi:hypothetical protein
MVPRDKTMMIMDRMSFEYKNGLAHITDPSRAELDTLAATLAQSGEFAEGIDREFKAIDRTRR